MAEINLKALNKTSNKLRISEADIHTVLKEYFSHVDDVKPSQAETVAYRYGRNWYVVGQRVNGKKNVPEGVEIVEG